MKQDNISQDQQAKYNDEGTDTRMKSRLETYLPAGFRVLPFLTGERGSSSKTMLTMCGGSANVLLRTPDDLGRGQRGQLQLQVKDAFTLSETATWRAICSARRVMRSDLKELLDDEPLTCEFKLRTSRGLDNTSPCIERVREESALDKRDLWGVAVSFCEISLTEDEGKDR